jgi:hypothetical protein
MFKSRSTIVSSQPPVAWGQGPKSIRGAPEQLIIKIGRRNGTENVDRINRGPCLQFFCDYLLDNKALSVTFLKINK